MSKYIELLIEGVEYKRQGKYELAKNKYIDAIKLDCKQPNGFYNLGKILYILKEFEASVRAYKTSFELGVDPYNVLIHLGHAILDKEMINGKYKNAVVFYQRGIDPYYMVKTIKDESNMKEFMNFNVNETLLSEYENVCIDAAKKYLNVEY